jgi:hypothetical protein
VAENLGSRPFNISFRRSLVADNLQDWHDLVMKLFKYTFNRFS